MENVNYNKIMEEEISTIKVLNNKPRLLLHCCCAPCFLGVADGVFDNFDVDLYFYNPNIFTLSEYETRLENLKIVVKKLNLKSEIICGEFEHEKFVDYISGLEFENEGGKRCEKCFEMRLAECARYAEKEHYDYFCTTLTVSPHKNSKLINEIGLELGKKYNVKYLLSDFKKKNGYLNSIKKSVEYKIYRQNFCGCEFSKR